MTSLYTLTTSRDLHIHRVYPVCLPCKLYQIKQGPALFSIIHALWQHNMTIQAFMQTPDSQIKAHKWPAESLLTVELFILFTRLEKKLSGPWLVCVLFFFLACVCAAKQLFKKKKKKSDPSTFRTKNILDAALLSCLNFTRCNIFHKIKKKCFPQEKKRLMFEAN